jgi:hypothetical protein
MARFNSKDHLVKECFRFKQSGTGCYKVMYRSPLRGLTYIAIVTDMTLIDKVMNEHDPTLKAMIELRSHIKRNGHFYPNFFAKDFKNF